MAEKLNKLYFGDNLPVLRQYIPDESVDLIYLDPPFNSKKAYNVLFQEKDGTAPAAQIRAFGDTWHWDQSAESTFAEMMENERVTGHVTELVKSLVSALGRNDVTAYLVMMAIRLVELKRVLKPTGSIYLHCDPTASHYLKILMDAIFRVGNLRAEIIWKRTYGHGGATNYHWIHDTILYYVKSAEFRWNAVRLAQEQSYLDSHYRNVDPDGRHYQLITAHGQGQGPERRFGDKVIAPPKGRHWMDQETIDRDMQEGSIVFTRSGMPRKKRYLDETEGRPIPDVWEDIFPINSQAQERLGYPTQKPEALLERIIRASSNEGDLVLDPFCGCGTTVAVAQRLGRRWIGIDITHLAIALMCHRLADQYGESIQAQYEIHGVPFDVESAKALAQEDRYQFQWWALELVGARPVGEKKKGADRGIDGRIYFFDEADSSKVKEILVSVKSGHVGRSDISDFRGVIEREHAQMGFFITLDPPTEPMRTEALSMESYETPFVGTRYPRMQILTIESLLAGQKPERPPKSLGDLTFKKAPSARCKPSSTPEIF